MHANDMMSYGLKKCNDVYSWKHSEPSLHKCYPKLINLEKKKRIWLCTSIVPVDSISQIQVMLLLLLLLLFTINIGEHLMDVLIT